MQKYMHVHIYGYQALKLDVFEIRIACRNNSVVCIFVPSGSGPRCMQACKALYVQVDLKSLERGISFLFLTFLPTRGVRNEGFHWSETPSVERNVKNKMKKRSLAEGVLGSTWVQSAWCMCYTCMHVWVHVYMHTTDYWHNGWYICIYALRLAK